MKLMKYGIIITIFISVLIIALLASPAKAAFTNPPTFDLTTTNTCAGAQNAVYTVHIENPDLSENAIALSIIVPAGYEIDPAYITTTPGILVATGPYGTVTPFSTLGTITIKTTTTALIYQVYVDGTPAFTGTLVLPTSTTPGNIGGLFLNVYSNWWVELKFAAGVFINPSTPGTYICAPNYARPSDWPTGADVLMDPRSGYTNEIDINICGSVGGYLTPANKLALLTPYLALAGLIAAISTIFVIKKRK